ncbi:S-adenosyl-L-methionine-dependent methyltransferase [Lecanosticta acicola]|uniref:S-adenosyl-L-methionine-dependent methyltransferase n=1 Tax=Lecanosticta acicola TaxID=111012 RepID=A0AAI8YX71_9PEZI|nr:S-adenosyl-L-methionine-dependent methyltransferase [Lecanosticta acicola]
MDHDNPTSSSIATLVSKISSIATDHPDGIETEPQARAALLQASRALVASLEEPYVTVEDLAFGPYRLAAVQLAVDIGLFEKLTDAEGPLTLRQLAAMCEVEETLLKHIAIVLVAQNFIAEDEILDLGSGQHAYTATSLAKHMTKPNVQAGVRYHLEMSSPIVARASAFFRQNDYRLPRSMTAGLFNYALDTKEDSFAYWGKRPEASNVLNTFFQGYFERPNVTPLQWFPYDQVIFNDFDSCKSGSEYMYVDVGGGKGLPISRLLQKYPFAADKGKFALEDLPQAINQIGRGSLDSRIECVAHDFFTPQPIRGARAYFLENILHNWTDDSCRQILGHIRDAMTPEYSKLMVSAKILPNKEVPQFSAQLDFYLLLIHNSRTRNKSEWLDLIGSVHGLDVVKVWSTPDVVEGNGVLEVERTVDRISLIL